MHTCIYIYIYIHTRVYIYIYMSIYIYICLSLSLSIYIYIYIYIHVCTHITSRGAKLLWSAALGAVLDTLQRGVQWIGGAVDLGSMIE